VLYSREQQIPKDPLKELDEFYCKDEKILVVDLQRIANEKIQKEED